MVDLVPQMCLYVFDVIRYYSNVCQLNFFFYSQDLVSQIGIMYLICGLALFFYVTKVPEIWFPGEDTCVF